MRHQALPDLPKTYLQDSSGCILHNCIHLACIVILSSSCFENRIHVRRLIRANVKGLSSSKIQQLHTVYENKLINSVYTMS